MSNAGLSSSGIWLQFQSALLGSSRRYSLGPVEDRQRGQAQKVELDQAVRFTSSLS
jgi:hypothetical protein